MKTAEEILKEAIRFFEPKFIHEPNAIQLIKSWQLDSYKQGMKDAAEILRKHCEFEDNGMKFYSNHKELEAHTAILSTAEKVKEI